MKYLLTVEWWLHDKCRGTSRILDNVVVEETPAAWLARKLAMIECERQQAIHEKRDRNGPLAVTLLFSMEISSEEFNLLQPSLKP